MKKSIRLFWIFLFLSFSRSLCIPRKNITLGATAFSSVIAASTIKKSYDQKNLRAWILNENFELEAPCSTEANYNVIKKLMLNEGIVNPELLNNLSSSITYLDRPKGSEAFFFHEKNVTTILLKIKLQSSDSRNILKALDIKPHPTISKPWGINESYPHAIFGGVGILNDSHPIYKCISNLKKEDRQSEISLKNFLSNYPKFSDNELNYESIVNDLLKTAKILSNAIFALQTNYETGEHILEKIPAATLYLPTNKPQNECALVISEKILESKTIKYSLIFFATEEDANFAATTLRKTATFN